ncbi:hypothetical protein C1H46_043559 [Malus baccata]|uniref:Uncharacterized protein n=1 Tax=Malus baccata TaxID=106549 RepID=A0A540K9R2_MALBA|nr:hypothetical protein C1H46_043559 [Malus baccata]
MVLTTAADEMPDLLGDVWGGVRLTWSTPDCPDCETRGGESEFVPFSLRSPSSGSTSTAQGIKKFSSAGTFGKAVLDRTKSSTSNNSDDEAHQYWCHQLHVDITPDFKVMWEDESQGLGNLSLAGLSLHDDVETTRFAASTGSGYLLKQLPWIRNRRGAGEQMKLIQEGQTGQTGTTTSKQLLDVFSGGNGGSSHAIANPQLKSSQQPAASISFAACYI